jgi:hypothetical protein
VLATQLAVWILTVPVPIFLRTVLPDDHQRILMGSAINSPTTPEGMGTGCQHDQRHRTCRSNQPPHPGTSMGERQVQACQLRAFLDQVYTLEVAGAVS